MTTPAPPAPPTPQQRKPGLPAIYAGREARARGKYSRPTTGVLLFAIGGVTASLIAYNVNANRKINATRSALLQKQRAVATTVGQQWYPLREKLEGLTLAAAHEFKGDSVQPEVAQWDFRTMPGLYLRLRVAEAKDVASLRAAAAESQRDSFVGCLLREPNSGAARGERDAGPFAEQPWNLRQAYAATRVLSEEWVAGVKEATDDLPMRIFEQQYEKAARDEVPLAIDILQRAQFFLLVLDEDVPAAKALSEDGGISPEVLQLVPHPSRVHIVNLKTGGELVRLRRVGEANFVSVGEQAAVDPEISRALKRQVNNCALAHEVQDALHAAGSPARH